MAEVIFADPTTTMDANTQKVLSILPPIEEVPTPVPIARPIDSHATPHTTPRIQQQIQETGQTYTPRPWYDGKPGGASVGSANTLRSVTPLTAGQSYAQDEAAAALAFAAGLAISGFYDGVTKAHSNDEVEQLAGDPDLGAPYYIGNKLGDKIRDIADNPPHFEIPQIKIPKIELPHLPEIKLPELPELKIPEFKFPEPRDKDKPNIEPKISKPKPIPKNKNRQLRELELSPCGSISFSYARAIKYIGRNNLTGERIGIQASIGEVYAAWLKYNTEGAPANEIPSLEAFLEAGGVTGEVRTTNVDGATSYRAYPGVGGQINAERPTLSHPFDDLYYPYYSYGTANIEVLGTSSNSAINKVLDTVDQGGRFPGQVYAINVSNPDARDCPLGKRPPPDDPPDPPEKKMCCPEIDYRKIKAMIDDAISKLDLVAAIPMSWQIRNEGGKPQLIIQCAEENGVDKKGNKKYKSAMYPISVPHWDGSATDKISLPSYIKGNYEGIYTLNDNSKVTINAKNEVECKRILNAIIPHIPKQFAKDAYFKGGVIVRDKPIKESRVKPRYGRYFKEGQKNNKPDWRVEFT